MQYENYRPRRNENGRVIEPECSFVERMRTVLPNWPPELVREWLYGHQSDLPDYDGLDFERFDFRLESWPLHEMPGVEVFSDPRIFEGYLDMDTCHDWLASFMRRNGTWSNPILLFHDRGDLSSQPTFLNQPLRSPFHLLDGQRRLAFLNALRRNRTAQSHHPVWRVSMEQP